jgi:hypothetical protein
VNEFYFAKQMGLTYYNKLKEEAAACCLCKRADRYIPRDGEHIGELAIEWYEHTRPFHPELFSKQPREGAYGYFKALSVTKQQQSVNNGIWICWFCRKTIIKVKREVYFLQNPPEKHDEQERKWKWIHEFMIEIGKCAFCNLQITSKNAHQFEWDHKDHKETADSAIVTMILKGSSDSAIYQELQHCQPACIQCHKQQTRTQNEKQTFPLTNNILVLLTVTKDGTVNIEMGYRESGRFRGPFPPPHDEHCQMIPTTSKWIYYNRSGKCTQVYSPVQTKGYPTLVDEWPHSSSSSSNPNFSSFA